MAAETIQEYLLAIDIDDTAVPTKDNPLSSAEREASHAALRELTQVVQENDHIVEYGTATGRSLDSCLNYAENEVPVLGEALAVMSFTITSVGTALHRRIGNEFVLDLSWPQVKEWNRAAIKQLLKDRPEIDEQILSAQNDYKLSYNVTGVPDSRHSEYVGEFSELLADRGLKAHIAFSCGEYLDFLPLGVNKGSALKHLAGNACTIAADDSMNGAPLLAAADLAIVPSNAQDSLKSWVADPRNIAPSKLYLATQPYAAGILEGLRAHNII